MLPVLTIDTVLFLELFGSGHLYHQFASVDTPLYVTLSLLVMFVAILAFGALRITPRHACHVSYGLKMFATSLVLSFPVTAEPARSKITVYIVSMLACRNLHSCNKSEHGHTHRLQPHWQA